jgi:hypothetical protein
MFQNFKKPLLTRKKSMGVVSIFREDFERLIIIEMEKLAYGHYARGRISRNQV